jgi:hypothetical protein
MQLIATIGLVYLLTSLLLGPIAAQYRTAAWTKLRLGDHQQVMRRAVRAPEPAPYRTDVESLPVERPGLLGILRSR